ncbi:unnamed protein product [Ambrosiozyma monospora]|uniref:Unnamed protein product n=1 Tax=Ambrosiozyma monospora TaxID=43982 RepID=A0ACB5SXK9_AMBMO|nr:unnamed protein product [Ambrosiozyma monospora]
MDIHIINGPGDSTEVPNHLPKELLVFISDLPSNVSNLSLVNFGFSLSESSLKLSPTIEQLSLTITCSKLDLSILPSTLKKLNVTGFTVLSGQFPTTLEILDIDISLSSLSCSVFWSKFITTLPNLKRLKITGDCTETVDFRKLKFPNQLFSLSLALTIHWKPVPMTPSAYRYTLGGIIVDRVPLKLVYWGLPTKKYMYQKYKVTVDGSKGETVKSVTDKLSLEPNSVDVYQLEEG